MKKTIKILAMKHLTYEPNGSTWLVYIHGNTPQEMEERYNSLYNWNAVNYRDELSEFNWVCWTTPEKMFKYFTHINLFKLVDDGYLVTNQQHKFKGKKGGAMDLAREMAKLDMSQLQRSDFIRGQRVNLTPTESDHEYSFSTSNVAEKPDTDLKDYFIMRGFSS